MTKLDFDMLVTQIGNLRERSRHLADEDYISAKYKGYSSEGLTLEEVIKKLRETEDQIEKLERELDHIDDEL